MPNETTIRDWNHFVEVATKLSDSGPRGAHIFRGQADNWKLYPSLTRILNKHTPEQYLHIEKTSFDDFKRKAPTHAEHFMRIPDAEIVIWWEMMQQYGAPTRLLDWSKSPYVALYFAVNDLFDKNGYFISLDVGHLNFVHQSRYTGEPKWYIEVQNEIHKNFSGHDYKKVLAVIGCPKPTNRMIAQQSSFTVCSNPQTAHDSTADEFVFSGVYGGKGHSIFHKYIIPNNFKLDFLSKLQMMNITASALFPGIDGLGKATVEDVKIMAHRI